MSDSIRVLIVEDSVDDAFFVIRELIHGGFKVVSERVDNADAMQAALGAQPWDLIISDYALPNFGGTAALRIHQRAGLDIPFIVVSGIIGEERAVHIVKAGAHDIVMKSNLTRLVPVVTHELQAARERRIRKQTEAIAGYLASLVESCDDAIIGKTLEGTVISWNAGAERLYGYTPSEIIGHSISMLFPHYGPHELLEKIREGKHGGRYETIGRRKDGTLVNVSFTISPVNDASGRIIGASTIARDVTQRKMEEKDRLILIEELTTALRRATNPELRTADTA